MLNSHAMKLKSFKKLIKILHKTYFVMNVQNLETPPAHVAGFIDFIVEPTMMVCGEMLTKMVEPLVSLPSSDSLFPPGSNNDGREGSVSGASLSPVPDMSVEGYSRDKRGIRTDLQTEHELDYCSVVTVIDYTIIDVFYS